MNQDVTWLATSSEDGTLKVWDIRAPTLQRNYNIKFPVNDVAAHPNQGEIISCDQNGSVQFWDLGENKSTFQLTPVEGVPMRSCAISSDCTTITAGNHKGTVFVWRTTPGATDLRDVNAAYKIPAHDNFQITRLQLSLDYSTPNGKLNLATCSADKTVKIWQLEPTGYKLKTTLVGHLRWVWDCAFSADSAYMVTASSDQTARLWDLASGEAIRQYNGHQKAVTCVALNDLSAT